MHIREELRAPRVNRELVIAQSRILHDTPGNAVDLFVAQYAGKKARRIKLRKLAFVVFRKVSAFFLKPSQIADQFGSIFSSVKIAQVPLRQIAKLASAPAYI